MALELGTVPRPHGDKETRARVRGLGLVGREITLGPTESRSEDSEGRELRGQSVVAFLDPTRHGGEGVIHRFYYIYCSRLLISLLSSSLFLTYL